MANFCPVDSTHTLPTHICTSPPKKKWHQESLPSLLFNKAAMQLAILGYQPEDYGKNNHLCNIKENMKLAL